MKMSKNGGLKTPCHRWTPEKDEVLRGNYVVVTREALAQQLGCSLNALRYRAKVLGVTKEHHHRWTLEEDEWLRANYADMTSVAIAEHLMVGHVAVQSRATTLHLTKNHRWSREERAWLTDNYAPMANPAIALMLGVSANSVGKMAGVLGLKKTPTWTTDTEKWLRTHHSNTDNRLLAAHLNIVRNAVLAKARSLGLRKNADYLLDLRRRIISVWNRKYEVDHDYFSTIDSLAKAYWLGWLWADGCVYSRMGYAVRRITLGLADGDGTVVHRFANAVKSTAPVTKRPTWGRCQAKVVCTIISTQMFQDLVSKGVVPNKTVHAGIPKLPQQFFPEFIRGVFDGDGSIFQSGVKRYPGVTICGTQRFCIWLESTLRRAGIRGRWHDRQGCSVYAINGFHQCAQFARYIYKSLSLADDPTLVLERKHDRFVRYAVLSHECTARCNPLRESGGFRKDDLVLVRDRWRMRVEYVGANGILGFSKRKHRPGEPYKSIPARCKLLSRPKTVTYRGHRYEDVTVAAQ